MSSPAPSPSPPLRGAPWLETLSWASFLGMSWTWCIGMFLPVILLRQFGFPGWLIFALPNVIGAAAMGWILRSRRDSRTLIRNHAPACSAFSLVTIAFHFFFVSWILERLVGVAGPIVFLAALAAFQFVGGRGGGGRRGGRDRAASLLLLLLSLTAMAIFLLGASQTPPATDAPNSSTLDLVALSTVCLFGFAFCPYLDLTFHRARRALDPPAAKWAFGIGFGAIFFPMILFTLFYAPPVAASIFDGQSLLPLLAWIIAGHMAVQSAFTVSVHHRELRRQGRPVARADAALMIVGTLFLLRHLPAALTFNDLANPLSSFHFTYHGLFNTMTGGEWLYRLFMAFYGLFFPAYVWLRIVPANRFHHRHPVTWKTFALLSLAALPFYYLGFIEAKPWCLIPGVLLLLLGRWLGAQRIPS
jgi:hypothetical protein